MVSAATIPRATIIERPDPADYSVVASQQHNHDPASAKELGQARENRNQMDENDGQGLSPFDAP
jgi:hypothetical protein